METISQEEVRIINMCQLTPMIIDWQSRKDSDDINPKKCTELFYLDFVDERVFCLNGQEADGLISNAVLDILRIKKREAQVQIIPEDMMNKLNSDKKNFSIQKTLQERGANARAEQDQNSDE